MHIPDLKPKSPDFRQESDRPEVESQDCDIPGCPFGGLHRAPKSRALNEYYNFCLDHVTEYNKNWNFFEGMSQSEIEHHMYRTMTWDRPTWESTMTSINPEYLKKRVFEGIRMDGFDMGGSFSGGQNDNSGKYNSNLPAPELDALSVLGLEPPVDWPKIRTQYKKLVKEHHPDVKDDKGEDEMIKKINIAYSILKVAYQKFEVLEKKDK